MRELEANSGWSASICALPSTTVLSSFDRSKSPSPSAMKMFSSSRPPSVPTASRSRSGSVLRISCSVSPASRSLRIWDTCCTDDGRHQAGDLDEDRADHAAAEIEHQQQALGRDLDQLQPLQDHVIQRRRHRHAQLLRQHAENLRRPAKDLLHRASGPHQLRPEGMLLLMARGREPHDGIHVHPVGPVGGNPAGRGMRMKEIALVLQLAHDAPDGGRRHPEPEPARDRLAAGGLRSLDVGVHDGLENAQLALTQLIWSWHASKSRGRPGRKASYGRHQRIQPQPALGGKADPARGFGRPAGLLPLPGQRGRNPMQRQTFARPEAEVELLQRRPRQHRAAPGLPTGTSRTRAAAGRRPTRARSSAARCPSRCARRGRAR